MGSWNFRKSLNFGKLFRLNIGSQSLGLSVGVKGARVGINTKRGLYTHASIPGTGIYNRSYLGTNVGTSGAQVAPTIERCGACSHKLRPADRFCPNCGSPAVSLSFESTQPPPLFLTLSPHFTGEHDEIVETVRELGSMLQEEADKRLQRAAEKLKARKTDGSGLLNAIQGIS